MPGCGRSGYVCFSRPAAATGLERGGGGTRAFYLRDPDGHFLEILEFPSSKGKPKCHKVGGGLFLGIDHTATVVKDTEVSLHFYRDICYGSEW
jgi:catechol 2,3-dioxygenase-like lactoylglutathione lyase family enzyme